MARTKDETSPGNPRKARTLDELRAAAKKSVARAKAHKMSKDKRIPQGEKDMAFENSRSGKKEGPESGSNSVSEAYLKEKFREHLRSESGAAVSPAEFEAYKKKYEKKHNTKVIRTPQGKETAADKEARLAEELEQSRLDGEKALQKKALKAVDEGIKASRKKRKKRYKVKDLEDLKKIRDHKMKKNPDKRDYL